MRKLFLFLVGLFCVSMASVCSASWIVTGNNGNMVVAFSPESIQNYLTNAGWVTDGYLSIILNKDQTETQYHVKVNDGSLVFVTIETCIYNSANNHKYGCKTNSYKEDRADSDSMLEYCFQRMIGYR